MAVEIEVDRGKPLETHQPSFKAEIILFEMLRHLLVRRALALTMLLAGVGTAIIVLTVCAT